MSLRKDSKRRQVVAFRKALALHQVFALQHRVGQQKAVGGDEIDLGRVRPAGEQGAQYARRRRLADRNRAGDGDDERRHAIGGAEEGARRLMQGLRRANVKTDQARQRQVNLDHVVERDRVVERPQPREVLAGERQRRIGAQLRPLLAAEQPMRRQVLWRRPVHQRFTFPRAAFSASPPCEVRFSSSAITADSSTPPAFSMTSRW